MNKRQHKQEELRDACVREALAVIGESGVDSLSLREVARRLGVSHQAPYKHFASRDHILAEVVRRAFANFAEYLEARPRSEDADQDLASMGRAYLQYAHAHPLHYTLMFETRKPDPAQHPAMMEQAKHAFSLLATGLRRLPYRDAARPPELDALFVWSCLHGLASILKGQALDTIEMPQDLVQHAAPFVLGRIGAALGMPEPLAAQLPLNAPVRDDPQ
ncbi:MAG: TetR/AcrR family transcriptional regulator [Bryobacteraceae bacterium]|nr:TetR/AcrR family transcriptional regulator [Bryobacteraceae bacterium]